MATRNVPAHVAKSRIIDFFKQSEGHSAQPLQPLEIKILQKTDYGEQIDKGATKWTIVHKKCNLKANCQFNVDGIVLSIKEVDLVSEHFY